MASGGAFCYGSLRFWRNCSRGYGLGLGQELPCNINQQRCQVIETVLRVGRGTRAWPGWARYGTGLLFVSVALFVRIVFSEHLEEHPFLLFFPTVLICTFLFQLPVVGFALVLDIAMTLYFLVEPHGEFRPADLNDAVRLATAAIMVAIMGMALQALIRAHDQLRSAYNELSRTEAVKTALMREMHHRIKNNLQLVASMLRLEAGTASNPEAKMLLRGSADRVVVIGRLHGQLQGIGAADLVEMRSFLEELCTNLRAAAVSKGDIEIRAHADPITLPSEQATSVGLVINELVTNALKHAFPDKSEGLIAVKLERDADSVILSVTDNGRGLQDAAEGTGTRLVQAMVARLNGEIELLTDKGTSVTVRFPEPLS